MATTKTKKYMPEVKATGKGTAAGALIGTLIKKGVLDKEQTRTRAKQYRKLTGKGLSDGQAISKIKLYESLLIKPKTPKKPKKQEGGQAVTSGRMTRLGNKIAKKTGTGKTVSTGLQRRFDKSVDKVIVKQLKKSTKSKKAMGGPTEGDGNVETPVVSSSRKDLPFVNAATVGANGQPIGQAYANQVNKKMRTDSAMGRDVKNPLAMNRVGGAKMAYGGVAKKPLRKANNGIIAGSTTPAPTTTPTVKQAAFKPPTPEENKYLVSVYNQRNKTTLPEDTPMSPSSENFRTRAGGFGVSRTPNQKPVTPPIPAQKRGGAKMAKGGMTKAKRFAALAPPYNKATAADRIAGAKKKKRK